MKPNNKPFVIGLTGTIASGKSTVSRLLAAKLSAEWIDADKVGHVVVDELHEEIAENFGEEVVQDGTVDRSALGVIVFHSAEKLRELNELVHPEICRKIAGMIEESERDIVLLEAVELLRSDLKNLVDEVWVVYAAPSLRLKRLMETRGLTLEAAQARIESQQSDEEYLSQADVVIETFDGPMSDLSARLDEEAIKVRERIKNRNEEAR